MPPGGHSAETMGCSSEDCVACGNTTASAVLDCTESDCREHDRRFIMDYSMNKVAKYFRLLGYDTICDPHISHDNILRTAVAEHRVLVTCSRALERQVLSHNSAVRRRQAAATPLVHRVVAYDSDGDSVYSTSSEECEREVECLYVEQWRNPNFVRTMAELTRRARLVFNTSMVFARCVGCNVSLREVAKSQVRDRVQPRVYDTYSGFTECPACGKVFWGYEDGKVSNYKTYRTLSLLQSMCAAAQVPTTGHVTPLNSLESFCAFPRSVKACVFSFLTAGDLCRMRVCFPTLADLMEDEKRARAERVTLTSRAAAPPSWHAACEDTVK